LTLLKWSANTRIQATDERTHGADQRFDAFAKASVAFFRLKGNPIQVLDQLDMGFC
jgi:hypothetical protein